MSYASEAKSHTSLNPDPGCRHLLGLSPHKMNYSAEQKAARACLVDGTSWEGRAGLSSRRDPGLRLTGQSCDRAGAEKSCQ